MPTHHHQAQALDLRTLAGKRVTIMGLGLFGGGAAVARWLVQRGAQVCVTDRKSAAELAPSIEALSDCDVRWALGAHKADDFTNADMVVVNPAVPPTSQWIELARKSGARITSEMELFLAHCPARVVLITGTQGKSSTANYLAQLLTGSFERVFLGGNIGRSLLDDIDAMSPNALAVVEISSYQLEALPLPPAKRADVPLVIITNLLADHIERHGSVASYHAAKQRVLDWVNPDGCAIVPAALSIDNVARSGDLQIVRHGSEGDWQVEADQALRVESERITADRLPRDVAGTFQVDNILTCVGAARALGVSLDEIAARLPVATGLPHRLERLGRLAGRSVINNGVSTTPDSTIAALAALDAGCTLICGGQHKRSLPLEPLAMAARARATRVVVFGRAAAELEHAFARAGVHVSACTDLDEAVASAWSNSEPGATVLFSPACASFDAYPNFRARAEDFLRLVRALDARTN